jgi:hypothetical protein
MTAPPGPLSSKDVSKTHEELRNPELGPARRRERLVQRVLAARKRLPQTPPSALARTR